MQQESQWMAGIGSVIKWTLSALSAFWITVPIVTQTLVTFMAFDFASGLYVAAIDVGLTSAKAFRGLGKKLMILGAVALAHRISKALNLSFDLGTLAATAYAVHEFISIAENFDKAGVWFPDVVLDALQRAKGLSVMDKQEIRALQQKQAKELADRIEREKTEKNS